MKKKKRLKKLIIVALVLSIYPLFALIYTWSHVYQSELEGGRHGPLDAYRHTLASAVVSYTLSENAVSAVTSIMEWGEGETRLMDKHNNMIGAQIGANAKSFQDIEPEVRKYISEGMINSTDPARTTWLPKERWKDRRAW